MKTSPIEYLNGRSTWVQIAGDEYLATGTDRDGKRFRIKSAQWGHINGINMWRGTKWLLRNGKKHKISTAVN